MRGKNLAFRDYVLAIILFTPLLLSILFPLRQGLALPYPPAIQIMRPRYNINAVRLITAPQEILIKFKLGVTQIPAIYAKYQLKEISFSPYSGIRRCYSFAQIPLAQVIALLRAEPAILYAEPNLFGYTNFVPNDPYLRYQWHLPAMNMDTAWDISTGSGVVVAVLDTGVAFENFDIYAQAPDLIGTTFTTGYDFVNDDPNPDDDDGHGTHITGTIAQTTNNALGCAGGAFGATIMPVKVMDNTGSGTLTDIVDGIYYAANNGAKIINLSLGFGDNPTLALEDAVNYAYDNGCLLVCSAGNDGTNTPNYPASYPVCLSVSAVRFDLTLGDYSNYGADIDICAPGGDLTVDQNLDGYPDGILQQTHDGSNFQNFGLYMGRGTSWSAANVSAVAALALSASGGTLTPTELTSILETTARDLGTAGWDEYYGWGLVDAYAAVNAAVATIAQTLGTRLPFTPYLPPTPYLPSYPSATPFLPGAAWGSGTLNLQGLMGANNTRAAQTESRLLAESGTSPLVAQIMGLVDQVFPFSLPVPNNTLNNNNLFTMNVPQYRSSSANQTWIGQNGFSPWPWPFNYGFSPNPINSWSLVPGVRFFP